tara:strand:- start:627 stop:1559 length:933 start_codon:yes stop_codon:yes gene_type:complete
MKILKPKFWDKKELSLFSLVLLPFAFLYQLLISAKSYLVKKKDFSIPIICVGNIYIGGTGKTPISIKIFETLKELKMKPIIIKKDYENQKDEVLLLKKYCQVLVSKKRSEGIYQAIEKKFDVIILDDGYQDFEVKKNINIVCFNSRQKIGNGFVIPAGPLRQSLKSLNNCDMIFFNGKKDIDFETKLKKYNPKLKFVYYEYVSKNLNEFKNKKLIAFAGIGNPENFFDFLKKNNLNVIKEIKYPDHYNYSKKNLDHLVTLKKKYNARLITTEKDYMRIDSDYHQNFDFISIKTNLEDLNFLKNLIGKKIL